MEERLIQLHQARLAQLAIGASTARGQGAAGVVSASRSWLATCDLRRFLAEGVESFPRALDRATEAMRVALPAGAQNWGAARKFLNIFLRDSLYNRYTCRHFELEVLEPQLEIPLDAHAARGLSSEPEGSYLPRWQTIKHLKSEVSAQYQEVASKVAVRCGHARVHLDLVYWRRMGERKYIDAKID